MLYRASISLTVKTNKSLFTKRATYLPHHFVSVSPVPAHTISTGLGKRELLSIGSRRKHHSHLGPRRYLPVLLNPYFFSHIFGPTDDFFSF